MASLTDVFRPVLELHYVVGRGYNVEFAAAEGPERQAVVHCACRQFFRAGQAENALRLWAAHVADELLAVTRGTAEALGIRRRG